LFNPNIEYGFIEVRAMGTTNGQHQTRPHDPVADTSTSGADSSTAGNSIVDDLE
jgi:hypothetical protein